MTENYIVSLVVWIILYASFWLTKHNPVIIKSGEQFGEIVCSRIIFISQRFYRFLKEKKLNRGLQYEPIQLA